MRELCGNKMGKEMHTIGKYGNVLKYQWGKKHKTHIQYGTRVGRREREDSENPNKTEAAEFPHRIRFCWVYLILDSLGDVFMCDYQQDRDRGA